MNLVAEYGDPCPVGVTRNRPNHAEALPRLRTLESSSVAQRSDLRKQESQRGKRGVQSVLIKFMDIPPATKVWVRTTGDQFHQKQTSLQRKILVLWFPTGRVDASIFARLETSYSLITPRSVATAKKEPQRETKMGFPSASINARAFLKPPCKNRTLFSKESWCFRGLACFFLFVWSARWATHYYVGLAGIRNHCVCTK